MGRLLDGSESIGSVRLGILCVRLANLRYLINESKK